MVLVVAAGTKPHGVTNQKVTIGRTIHVSMYYVRKNEMVNGNLCSVGIIEKMALRYYSYNNYEYLGIDTS
jgi:hypothetical protein